MMWLLEELSVTQLPLGSGVCGLDLPKLLDAEYRPTYPGTYLVLCRESTP